jgi:SAM-dependent methyltransferase
MTLRQWIIRIKRPAPLRIFRRTSPLSEFWGFDRGIPVDRYYIESFIEENRRDIAGKVLEVADSEYTIKFGSGLTQAEVLDIDRSNKLATLTADLSVTDQIPEAIVDCFILTQTLHLIFDIESAIANAHRLLRPGGVLLATLPCVSRIAPEAPEDYWRVTVQSCRRLFAKSFGAENISVTNYGNMATCIAFLQGMAYEELSHKELTKKDDAFPLIIAVRAVKAK